MIVYKVEQQAAQIEAHNDRLRALITVPEVAAVNAQYERSIRGGRKLLQVLTVSLKDNIDTDFAPTTAGAAFWRDRQPKHNAVVVQRLLEAGALLMGKANMTELAWGVRSYSAVGGQCLNPLDESRIAGGSSGGSAAAVAAGFCDASLGTDTGGSVRIPAAFCGLFGLRPTYGAIPNTGVLPLSHSHDTVGIIAKNSFDTARLFTAIAGYCPQDPSSRDWNADIWTNYHSEVNGLRIGIPEHYYYEYCTTEIATAVLQAAKTLEQQGARLIPIHIKNAEHAQDNAACMMSTEVTALYEKRLKENPHSISKPIRERMMQAFEYSGLDYANAMQFKRQWQWQLQRLYHQDVDLTLIPATATTAPTLSDDRSLLDATKDLARNTYPSAMAGIPSLAAPCGQDSNGLPIGLLLESAWEREGLLLRVARALEQGRGQ